MAKNFFKSSSFNGYYYDSETDAVYSIKRPGKTHQLAKNYKGGMWHVTLNSTDAYSRSGNYKSVYSRADILSMVTPPAVETSPVTPPATVSNDLALIKPTADYVMFSVKGKCSQYFFAGTSIADALAKFARRNIVIDPKDVRILTPGTNTVRSLSVKTVETYFLA